MEWFRSFLESLRSFLGWRFFPDSDYGFTVLSLLSAIAVILIARLIVWALTIKILPQLYRRQKVEIGAQYTINQLLKYFIYVIAFILAIQNLGINMNVFWGAIAALAVGFGLGLQQTFNDLFSGLIILFEGKIRVGDSVRIDTQIGRVVRIGIRTSDIETRDNIVMIVPNSKLVVEKVHNWNHDYNRVRFMLNVGVAYDSDPKLVRELLIKVAKEHPRIMENPEPFIRFADFGDSALIFELYFFSRHHIVISDTKSDMRFAIVEEFGKNNIDIPFPQRTVWSRQVPTPSGNAQEPQHSPVDE